MIYELICKSVRPNGNRCTYVPLHGRKRVHEKSSKNVTRSGGDRELYKALILRVVPSRGRWKF